MLPEAPFVLAGPEIGLSHLSLELVRNQLRSRADPDDQNPIERDAATTMLGLSERMRAGKRVLVLAPKALKRLQTSAPDGDGSRSLALLSQIERYGAPLGDIREPLSYSEEPLGNIDAICDGFK